MKKLVYLFISLSLFFPARSVFGKEIPPLEYQAEIKSHSKKNNYPRNPYVTTTIWNQVKPHFLPYDHPLRAKLDKIFSKNRVILSEKTMEKAGFENLRPRLVTHLIVTKHKKLKGYIVKAYLDNQRYYKDRPEYALWLLRIEGANYIRQYIIKHRLQNNFKVPKKWIYPLPANPSPPKEFLRKNFILVEEDMNLYDTHRNKEKWKSFSITKNKLTNLYNLITTLGMKDCIKIDNIPFSKDGKIAFIDTQSHHKETVHYSILNKYLTDSMEKHWKLLYQDNPLKKRK